MKNSRNPRSLESRRDFLRKASLVLAAAAIAPLNKRKLWDLVRNAAIPEALADTAMPIDFVLELAIPASFPFGDLFSGPGFLRGDVDADRGCSWNRDEMRAIALPNGRQLVLTSASEALAAHAANICAFDSMTQKAEAHPSVWGLRMAGWDQVRGVQEGSYGGAALSVLFAEAVALRRGAYAPATRGWVKEQRQVHLNRGSSDSVVLPGFTQMQRGPDQMRELFQAKPRTESNSELRRIIDAVKEINAVQADRALQLRVSNAGSARAAADQGVALITTERAIDVVSEYQSLASEFFANAGQDEVVVPSTRLFDNEANGPEDRYLGEALLKSFIGFKYNLVGAVSVHIALGHPHFSIVKLGDNSMRSSSKYVGDRLGAFLNRAKSTPHPFRPGRSIFDHLLVVCTGDTNRDLSFRTDSGTNISGYHWGEDNRKGAILIGGKINGGYLGDTVLPNGQIYGTVAGFDPSSGALGNGNTRVSAASVYKSLAIAAGISEADIRSQMGPHWNHPTIAAFFKA